MYGPTETTIWSTTCELAQVGDFVPLGEPIANTRLSVRAPSGLECPALVPGELRALLASTREPAPYVVAGHGLGAAFAAAFATLYPDITAAVVLLDAPKPNHPSADRAILGPMPEAMPWLARVGVTRLMKGPWGRDGDPAARAFMHRPDHLTRAAQELAAWDEAVRLASALGGTGSAPASTPVTALDLPAPLTTEQGAEAAVTAIRQAVTRVRRVR